MGGKRSRAFWPLAAFFGLFVLFGLAFVFHGVLDVSRAQMLAYRYQLCLSGFDVGTNFIWAANSNSVVLKEEAGWEVYYSALFRPWEHYIPLEPGCPDLPERLDWARTNPAACRDMTAAARAAVRMLSDRGGQLAMMRAVAETLPPATFPF